MAASKGQCFDGTCLLPCSAYGQRLMCTAPESTRCYDILGLPLIHHTPMACIPCCQSTLHHPAARLPVTHGESPHIGAVQMGRCPCCGLHVHSPADQPSRLCQQLNAVQKSAKKPADKILLQVLFKKASNDTKLNSGEKSDSAFVHFGSVIIHVGLTQTLQGTTHIH